MAQFAGDGRRPSARSSNSPATSICARTQDEEKRYQIAKDLSDNLTISYNTSEVIMARLMQTTNAKERVYAQAVSFFSTNDSVLTALKASFTGLFGLHESTQTLDAMKEGVSQEPRGSRRDRRQGGGGRRASRLRADHPRRRGEEARRLGRHLPGALARDRRRDAQARRPRTPPRSATRSRTASAASPGWWPRARRLPAHG